MKIVAIIPALNEEKTIGAIVYALKRASEVDEVIVVSDGSTDHTELAARRAGAHVVPLPKNIGKGGAMSVGAKLTAADVLLFLDGDLTGVEAHHIHDLLKPVLDGAADMAVGVTDRWRAVYDLNEELHNNLPLAQLSGQRAMKREIFDEIPEKLRKGYQIEEALNFFCKVNNYRVTTVDLLGVSGMQKMKKYAFAQGLWEHGKMIVQVVKIFFKVRFLHLVGKM